MEYSKRVLRALASTVYAYEKSIADLENGEPIYVVHRRWDNYGLFSSCRMCLAVGEDNRFSGGDGCAVCPLGPEHLGCNSDIGGAPWELDSALSFQMMRDMRSSGCGVLPALRRRLKWIIKKAEKNGVELVEA